MQTEKKLSRNQRYEAGMKGQGFKKVTFWIPEHEECNIRLVSEMMREDEDLTLSNLRSKSTGRMVSINKR